MKKTQVVFLGFIIILGSIIMFNGCFSLLEAIQSETQSQSTSQTGTSSSTTSNNWAFGEFTNEWGDKSGKFFMKYSKKIDGTYSKQARSDTADNAPLSVINFIFSDDYISFDLNERGIVPIGGLLIGNLSRLEVSVIFKTESHGEKTFSGRLSEPNTIVINCNDELLNMFKIEEAINFRVSLSLDNLRAYYQFNLPPNNFNSSYEGMKSLGNK
jgi:hypothetical protein